ncbi:MAG: hypothetical protein HEP71_06075 [Roseivirga sp.]|nr:hypothetical protein [Roseivirga sp.]
MASKKTHNKKESPREGHLFNILNLALTFSIALFLFISGKQDKSRDLSRESYQKIMRSFDSAMKNEHQQTSTLRSHTYLLDSNDKKRLRDELKFKIHYFSSIKELYNRAPKDSSILILDNPQRSYSSGLSGNAEEIFTLMQNSGRFQDYQVVKDIVHIGKNIRASDYKKYLNPSLIIIHKNAFFHYPLSKDIADSHSKLAFEEFIRSALESLDSRILVYTRSIPQNYDITTLISNIGTIEGCSESDLDNNCSYEIHNNKQNRLAVFNLGKKEKSNFNNPETGRAFLDSIEAVLRQ